jgi:hypothetical protein
MEIIPMTVKAVGGEAMDWPGSGRNWHNVDEF